MKDIKCKTMLETWQSCPTVHYILCGSQSKMKMQDFLFKKAEKEKVPKELKYKMLSFPFLSFLFCSFSKTVMVFSVCSESMDPHRHKVGTLYCSSVHVCSRPPTAGLPFWQGIKLTCCALAGAGKSVFFFPSTHCPKHRPMTLKDLHAPSQEAFGNWGSRTPNLRRQWPWP